MYLVYRESGSFSLEHEKATVRVVQSHQEAAELTQRLQLLHGVWRAACQVLGYDIGGKLLDGYLVSKPLKELNYYCPEYFEGDGHVSENSIYEFDKVEIGLMPVPSEDVND